ncbi:MAG: hypothetical protein JW966_13395 [Anaerolineae bacterium]|nr:hypothetical protein [Anaerolineae bacterium]
MTIRFRSVTLFLAVILLFIVSAAVSLQATAQDDNTAGTPSPEAAGDTAASVASSSVNWTVENLTFTSDYPAGFSFEATITSSAGPLERARIIWSHAPGTQRSRPAEIDADTGILTGRWDASGADAVPPWVGVIYYWDVTDVEGNAFQTEPQYVEYADDTRDWVRSESDDIIVFSLDLPSDINDLAVDAMAEQREKYRAAWGDLLPYKPRAILFGNREAWNEWQITYADPRVIGLTASDWGGTVQVVTNSGNLYHLAYGTVLHEVGHLYQSSFTVMAAGSWLIEGDATFFEIDQQYDYEGRVRTMAANGDLPVLLNGSGPGVSGRNARAGYDIGYTFFRWLEINYGLEGHRELIELLDTGIGRVEAIEIVTGLSGEEVESRWRVWLGASPIVPTLHPTPTIFFFPTVTPYGQ